MIRKQGLIFKLNFFSITLALIIFFLTIFDLYSSLIIGNFAKKHTHTDIKNESIFKNDLSESFVKYDTRSTSFVQFNFREQFIFMLQLSK